MDIGERIAKADLEVEAISLKPNDPFTWASGFRMPVYNDNRRLLDSYDNRMMVARGFRDMIGSDNSYDMIAGTSTAGIAPAASLAHLMDVPLVITEGGKAYVFGKSAIIGLSRDIDAVASTCPWAIPYGVSLANERKLPFMYVRQSKKEHGLKQQIEGIPRRGQRVVLMDNHRGVSYLQNATDALGEKGVVVTRTVCSNISSRVKPEDITGGKVLMIEDLISTGGSSASAVQEIRDLGGECNNCFSIFSYGLDKANQEFGNLDPDCRTESLLTYDTLLRVAKDTGHIDDGQVEMLAEWRQDPFGWGEKHGFLKVEK